MKILQVINSLGTGGAEKILIDSIPKYISMGVTMDLLVLDGTDYPFFTYLENQEICTIYTFGKGTVYNPFHLFRLIKILNRYDLLHVHLFPSLYWVSLAKIISFSKTPLFYTEHNTSNRRRGNTFLRLLDKFIYRRYLKIITISFDVDREIKQHLDFNDDRFQFIQNGILVSEIGDTAPAFKQDFSIPIGEMVLIQVSSFTKQKDQQTLIKSLVYLSEKVTLLLVGEGTLMEDCKTLVEKLGLLDRVQFLGNRMDVPKLLKMADIIILSTHYEGLSLSCMEGLAAGKPFVASNAPGLSSIVEGAGILFPIGDEKSLAMKLNELLQSETVYAQVAKKCLERAQHFSIEKMIDKHMNLYKQST